MNLPFLFDILSINCELRGLANPSGLALPSDIKSRLRHHPARNYISFPPTTKKEYEAFKEARRDYVTLIRKAVEGTPTWRWLKGLGLEMFFSLPTLGTSPHPFVGNALTDLGVETYIVGEGEEGVLDNLFKELEELEGEIFEGAGGALPSPHTPETIALAARAHERRGTYLSYPPCCVERFVSGWKEGVKAMVDSLGGAERAIVAPTLEFTISIEVIERGLSERVRIGDLDELATERLPRGFYAFPYDNFYPCRVGCPAATYLGLLYEEKLDEGLRRKFRRNLLGRVALETLEAIRYFPSWPPELKRAHPEVASFVSSLRPGDLNKLLALVEEVYGESPPFIF